jgi:hypothetical protein
MGFDASAPVAALGPAPRHRIRGGEQQFARRSPVFVAQGAAGRPGELDEPLVVPVEQRVVLLEDEHRVAAASGVEDEGMQARRASLAFVAVAARSTVYRARSRLSDRAPISHDLPRQVP